jgi:hypothetical protein
MGALKEIFMRVAEKKAWESFDVLMIVQDKVNIKPPRDGIIIQGRPVGFACNNPDGICFRENSYYKGQKLPVKIVINRCLRPGQICENLVFKFVPISSFEPRRKRSEKMR